MKRRMNPPRSRTDQSRQRVQIRSLQLCQMSAFDNFRRQWMNRRQLLQNLLIRTDTGASFLDDRQIQCSEQHFTQLFGRIDVKRRSGQIKHFSRQRLNSFCCLRTLLPQFIYIHSDARMFQHGQQQDQRAFDAIVLPSRWEAFGLVAVEAMRNARPVLVSNRGALPELVIDGYNGLVFDMDDPNGLAQALDRVATLDLARMGDNARAVFNTIGDLSGHLEKVDRVYATALARKG